MEEQAVNPVEEPAPESGSVFNALRKLTLASIGAVIMAQDELEGIINKMVERGEVAEKDAKKLADEVVHWRKENTKKAEMEFDKHFEQAMHRLNLPTRDDVDALTNKINQLAKKVEELKKSG